MLKREWGAESNGKLPHLFIPMFFTRLTSWGQPVRSQRGVETSLHSIPFPLASSLSLFLSSLGIKFKTNVFPVQLKTGLEVVLSKLKIQHFQHYVQERVLFLQKHSHSLKLQYVFRAHVIFQFTNQQRRVRFVLGNVVKT